MNLKFKVCSISNYEQKRECFFYSLTKRYYIQWILSTLLLFAVVLYDSYIYYLYRNPVVLILTIAFCLIMFYRALHPFYYRWRVLRREMNKNGNLSEIHVEYSFFENYFEWVSIETEERSEIPYHRIIKCTESEHYFHLHTKDDFCYCISKTGFCAGMMKDFRTFIQQKIKSVKNC